MVIEKVISVDLQKFYCYPSGKSKTIVTEDSKEDCKFVKWVACKTNIKGNFWFNQQTWPFPTKEKVWGIFSCSWNVLNAMSKGYLSSWVDNSNAHRMRSDLQ